MYHSITAVPNFGVDEFHSRAVTYKDFTLGSVSKVKQDCLCGLVVRVPSYRSSGPRFDFQHYQIF
jgi:hypothetical protein